MNSDMSAAKKETQAPAFSRDYEKYGPNYPIKHLVLANKDFIIFVDHDGDVDWSTSPAFDENQRKDVNMFHAALNEASILETTPCEFLSMAIRINFKRLIGEAIAR